MNALIKHSRLYRTKSKKCFLLSTIFIPKIPHKKSCFIELLSNKTIYSTKKDKNVIVK